MLSAHRFGDLKSGISQDNRDYYADHLLILHYKDRYWAVDQRSVHQLPNPRKGQFALYK